LELRMTDDDSLIPEQDEQLYLGVLQQIYNHVEEFRAASGSTNLHGIEYCALQLRMALELVVMGSLVTNKAQIETLTSALANKKLDQARKLAKRANPDYWPKPTSPHRQPNGIIDLRPVEGALTEDKWERSYGELSELLHARNPYKRPIDIDKARERLHRIADELMALTNHYSVHLADRDGMLIAQISPEGPSVTHFGLAGS
jgi:hypothetical protein